MTQTEQQRAAAQFAEDWSGRGDEKSETHNFWIGLLHQVYGIDNAEDIIQFEKRVQLGHTSYIDGYIENTLVLIEQKSIGVNLLKKEKQSDGTELTPYEQAKRYANNLKRSEYPKYIITCNFKSFLVYDMENPDKEPEEILLENLEKEYYRLSFITQNGNIHIEREEQISKEAGKLVGRLYDALQGQYEDSANENAIKSLNALCVRLVFCLYAEDAGLFGSKSAFHDYMQSFNKENFRTGLVELFKVLNTPTLERDKYLKESLKAFPYVNGGLFADDKLEIPYFTDEIITLILEDCSAQFDWSDISPTIFGAVFESTLNPETRRSGGMHYTSIQNIHKVIDPLFLNGLKSEFAEIRQIKSRKNQLTRLAEFQDKIAALRFLDPACGSGNFLTESYISLRRLENDVLILRGDTNLLGDESFSPIKVNIKQFYGIEINDFAVSVAKAAMWIAEAQMQNETEKIINHDIEFFPLKDYVQIVEGNALELDWSTLKANAWVGTLFEAQDDTIENTMVVSIQPVGMQKLHFDYIMGNPPFVGYSLQTEEQKKSILNVYVDEKGKPYKTAGKIDFVAAWYFKAAKLIQGTNTKCALVSTNSITQGEQVSAVFKPLYERFGFGIDFAYRTFRWDSESFEKAHVHCVIVGFSDCHADKGIATQFLDEKNRKSVFRNEVSSGISYQCGKFIFDENGEPHEAKNINPYLIDAPNIFIESRAKPLCDVPEMTTGNRPADGGHLIIEANEYEDFIKKEPNAKKYIKNLLGSEEFINGKKRYCLWLVGTSPAELRKMPLVMERIEKCRQDRLSSPDTGRQKLAQTPTLFRETMNPASYIVVPKVSSERRNYIPMGFLNGDTISTDLNFIIPNATLYEFGILTSSVHMAWMRAVCGRLKSDYRYSKDIVYNNFVWPEKCHADSIMLTQNQENKNLKASALAVPNPRGNLKIAQTAQAILDARAKYPDCSLADLYDENTMPPELRKAHNENDKAVMQAYGFSTKMTEAEIVAELMLLHQRCKRQ